MFTTKVLPLVIYHGEAEWNVDIRFSGLFDAPSELDDVIPDFEYRLFDVTRMPEEEIRGAVLLQVILKTFKYASRPDFLHKIPEIFSLFTELGNKTKVTEYLEILLRYLGNTVESFSYEEIRNALKPVIKEGGDLMATIAQQLEQKGEAKGFKLKERNVIKNSLNLGLPLETIAKINDCSVDEIMQIAAQLKDTKNNEKKH